jgi:predicted Zn-dependent protease
LKLLLGFLVSAVCAAGAQDLNHDATPAPQNEQVIAANAALEARDWPKAVKLLSSLAEANPKDAHLLYDLGSAQDALDQDSEAEQSYRAAILDDGGYLEPRVALGLLLARSGRIEDARKELAAGAAVEKGDNALKARALRALARIDQKPRPAEARDELLAALSISPETPEDVLMSAELAETAGNGHDAAESQYRKLLAVRPNDPGAAAALGHLLVQQKKYDEAEKLLAAGLTAHPGDEAMTIQLAAVYTAEDKRAQALPLVQALRLANPDDPTVSRLLAELYMDGKDYEHAEPLLTSLCSQNPQDGGLADLRAQALLQLHQGIEAQRILTRVVADKSLFPSNEAWGQAAFDLAFSASANNEPIVVLQVLANRATVLPPSPPVLFLTAISQDKLHHVKLAAQAYKDFLAASNGALPNEEFEARHRLIALERSK